MKNTALDWLAFFAELCAGLTLAYFAAILLLPYAYEVRGYRAVGGEWLIILVAGLAGCWMVHRTLIWIVGKERFRVSATCGRCHRALKDPQSVERGYGPVCWGSVKTGTSNRLAALKRGERRHGVGADAYDCGVYLDTEGPEPVLVIEDINSGGRSATNSMEEILRDVVREYRTDLAGMKIIYRDSEGIYDGVIYDGGRCNFYPLVPGQRIADRMTALWVVRGVSGR